MWNNNSTEHLSLTSNYRPCSILYVDQSVGNYTGAHCLLRGNESFDINFCLMLNTVSVQSNHTNSSPGVIL